MDLNMLRLLFDYRGRISGREFLAGTVIVFAALGYCVVQYLDNAANMALMVRSGIERFTAYSINYQYWAGFVPSLVPAWFIISYTSFVLALKRIRSLEADRSAGIFCGVLNFAFYASLLALVKYPWLSNAYPGAYGEGLSPMALTVLVALLVLGIINILFLGRGPRSDVPKDSGRLNPMQFTLKTGLVMAITAAVSAAVGALVAFIPLLLLLLEDLAVQVVLGVAGLVPVVFYVKYAVCRLRDAGLSVGWIAVLPAFVVLTGLKFWVGMSFPQAFPACTFAYSFLLSFFLLAQSLLFLLPSRKATI